MNQLPFPQFLPKSDWKMPTHYPDLSDADEIGIDVETYDPELEERGPGSIRGKGFVTGYSIYVDGFRGYYPVRHSTGNLPFESVQRWLCTQLSRPYQPKITANGSYDREWCLADGISISGIVYDVQIAECLLDEELDSYTLDSLALRHLGEGKDEKLLEEAASWWKDKTSAKKIMHLLASEHVGPYAEADAEKTVKIFHKQKALMEKQGLMSIFLMESELSEVVFLMRQKGVRLDQDKCEELSISFRKKEMELYKSLQTKFFNGRSLDFNSSKDIESVCKAQSYFDYPRTNKGNPSFIGDWMDTWDSSTPMGEFFQGVSEFRTLEKIRRDFLEGAFTKHLYKGRLHAQFIQMRTEEGGTRSGRFACSDPNLQQIPKRSKFAKPVRTLFIPDEGEDWIKLDYSQQEYRIFVHYAMLCKLPGAVEAGQFYIENPNADFHQIIADITGLIRDDAKNWNFAAIYGAGLDKTAKMTKKTVAEAARLDKQYHEKVPYAKALAKEIASTAARRGWIRTLGERVLHFNTFEPAYIEPIEDYEEFVKKWGKRPYRKYRTGYVPLFTPKRIEQAEKEWPNMRLKRGQTHKTLNRAVQGSAADMTKVAMLLNWKMYKEVPLMQVHDELSYNGNRERGLRTKKVMEMAIPLLVPVYADLSMGKSWGEQVKVTLS